MINPINNQKYQDFEYISLDDNIDNKKELLLRRSRSDSIVSVDNALVENC